MTAQPSGARQFVQDLLLLSLLFAISTAVLSLAVYPALGWPSAAPMPARSILLAAAILLLLRLRRERLASIGLSKPRRIWLVPLLAIGFLAFQLFAIQPFTDWLRPHIGVQPTDYGIFAHIEGNLPAYVGWLAVAWLAGGFAEEVIFRGYLMNRIAAVAGASALAWTIAIVVQAALFGAGHLYLGAGTAINAGIGALARGVFFHVCGRNLWPLIIAHGLWDSLGFTLFFLQGVPQAP